MKVIGINGEEREVLSIKRIIHKVPDVLHKGKFINIKYIEVVIKGKSRTWKEWYPLENFRKMNPNVVI